MAVRLRVYTDPGCSASWAAEPGLRRLLSEFAAEAEVTFVMGGLAREYRGDLGWLVWEWLERAESSGMPVDPRLWREAPIATTYPACMAVKAAQQQGADAGARYLRALREGLMCFRRKLDVREALVEEARGAGLDVERFRVDLGSHAIVESFGTDLEEVRTVPDEARERGEVVDSNPDTHGIGGERLPFPSFRFEGERGLRWAFGVAPYDELRGAAEAAGAQPPDGRRPTPEQALRDLGRLATAELEAICDLPGPRAHAELWRLAAEWRVKPMRILTGWLWEAA